MKVVDVGNGGGERYMKPPYTFVCGFYNYFIIKVK